MEVDTAPHPVRLMGASLCRVTGSVVDRLLGMREGICRFNAGAGLRSALLYSEGWLLQWHEGPAEAVKEAWRLPAASCAHSPPRVIHRSVGPHGLVDQLHIATLQSGDKPTDVARRLHRVQREHAGGASAEPAAIWHRLSAPCLADSGEVESDARRDLVVVGSEYNQSIELIKAVAERYQATVGYQRFADCDIKSGDVGAAYVDVGHMGGVTRVQALSRRALANSMVRLSLRNVQRMVLLLGSRPQPAATLATSVATILNTLGARPIMTMIGPCPAIRAHAAEVFTAVPGMHVEGGRAGASPRAGIEAVLSVVQSKEQTRKHT